MRVLLISANTEQVNMPALPLGLVCVAASVRRAGHETVFVDLMSKPDVRAALRGEFRGFSPDVIGISVRNIDDQHLQTPPLFQSPGYSEPERPADARPMTAVSCAQVLRLTSKTTAATHPGGLRRGSQRIYRRC